MDKMRRELLFRAAPFLGCIIWDIVGLETANQQDSISDRATFIGAT